MSMIHDITERAGGHRKRLRKGRGESSGHGKTSGRGTKGSGARVGKPLSMRHEGGQTRIYRRLPTRGFSNHEFATRWYIVNLSDLDEQFEPGETVDAVSLKEKGLIPDGKNQVKILGDGNLTKKLTVLAGWYSKSAHQKIGEAGGAAQNAKGEPFVFPKPPPRFAKQKKQEGGKKAKAAAEPAAEGGAAAAPAPAPAAESGGAASE